MTAAEFVALRDARDVLSPEEFEQQPLTHPLAAARAAAARQPVIVTDKAIEKLRIARLTFEAAGSAAEIIADLANSSVDTDNTAFWLSEIDRTTVVLADLASALRRRNLRSVRP